MQWSEDNNLRFNEQKFVLLSFFNQSSDEINYSINEKYFKLSKSHRDLGIQISYELSWNEHYQIISGKAYLSLYTIRR